MRIGGAIGEVSHGRPLWHTADHDVTGSLENKASQKSLQPPKDTTDILALISGVIAEEDHRREFMGFLREFAKA